MNAHIDYSGLVLPDRVHGSIYTSPDVFEAELSKIFYRSWVCIGHVSEIPKPGDYRVTTIGRQSVIMVRGEDGAVRVLMNRCRHRGVTLANEETGSTKRFVCPYHGWAYDNHGALLAIPDRDGYPESLDTRELDLTPAPGAEEYRGLVFARLTAEGATLDEYLGLSKRYIDLFFDASPTGEVDASAGPTKTVFKANWKFVGMDGYHPHVVHQTFFNTMRKRAEKAGQYRGGHSSFSDKSGNLTRDLGNGHVLLDVYPERARKYRQWLEGMLKRPGWSEYYQAMVEAHGQDRADEVMIWEGDPHIGLFPNLQLIQSQIRIIRPLAADVTEVVMYPTFLQNVPESVNLGRLRRHEAFYGPASQGSPDDSEVFERNQIGLHADVEPWVYLARGLHRERVEPDGSIVGQITDETTQRGQLRQWKTLMSQPNPSH